MSELTLLGTVHSRAFDMPWFEGQKSWPSRRRKGPEARQSTVPEITSIRLLLCWQTCQLAKSSIHNVSNPSIWDPEDCWTHYCVNLLFFLEMKPASFQVLFFLFCFILYSIFTDWVVRKVKSYQVRHWIEPKGINVVQIVVRQVQSRQFGQVLKGIWLHRVQSIVAYVQRFQTNPTLVF